LKEKEKKRKEKEKYHKYLAGNLKISILKLFF